jgi:hypothetical protein
VTNTLRLKSASPFALSLSKGLKPKPFDCFALKANGDINFIDGALQNSLSEQHCLLAA